MGTHGSWLQRPCQRSRRPLELLVAAPVLVAVLPLLLAVDCSCSLPNAVLLFLLTGCSLGSIASGGGGMGHGRMAGSKFVAGTGSNIASFDSQEGELGDWAAF